MSTFSHWSNIMLFGWSLENLDDFRNYYNSNPYDNKSWDEQIKSYKDESFTERIEPIFTQSNVNFNLGGENDKAKLEFTDKPIGVFDFSAASQELYRLHEFYSQELKDKYPKRFEEYNLPSGVVPNYFIERKIFQNQSMYMFIDLDGTEYICSKRQKGMTVLLEEQPFLETIIQQGSNMLIPLKPTSKVKFASRTKKPYLKYKKQGGKVRYVEIYSANYYDRMSGDFQFAVRHMPAMMVAQYLEKMGTTTKLFLTRFVTINDVVTPKKEDISSGAILPLYQEYQKLRKNDPNYKNRNYNIIMPMCVKEYGEEIDLAQFFAVGSWSHQQMYKVAGKNMQEHEADDYMDLYGNPNWTEEQYQEGFERFRQKYAQYAKAGIWKAKEVTPQGLIFFHDLILNASFGYHSYKITRIFDETIEKLIENNPSVAKWFEMWMRVSSFTIKDKFEIFNSNNPTKTYREIIQQINSILGEIEMMIRTEQNTRFQEYLRDEFLPLIKNPTTYDYTGRVIDYGYNYDNPTQYMIDKINEMTIYAKNGYFETPQEDIDKRNEEAERLINELTKI